MNEKEKQSVIIAYKQLNKPTKLRAALTKMRKETIKNERLTPQEKRERIIAINKFHNECKRLKLI